MKKFFILFALLISFNLVSGLQASNVQFFRSNQEIDYVSFNPLAVDLHFDVTSDNLLSIFVDLSVLNRIYGHNTYVGLGQCDLNGSTYHCIYEDLILGLTNANVELEFRLVNTTGDEFFITIPYTFTIDNTRPSVSWMGTDSCLDDICYVADNMMSDVIIQLEDGLGNFDKKMVFFDFDGSKHWVDNCTGTNCHGLVRPSCNSGDQLKLMISSTMGVPSQDDAGNPISGGMNSVWVTCDSDAPQLLDIVVESDSDYGQIQEGDTLTITINLTEEVGAVTGTVNLSELNGDGVKTVECVEFYGVHTCEWSVSGIDAGTTELEFSFEDTAGNILETPFVFEVLPTIGDRVPDCFTISTDPIAPGSIDRIMLQLALDNNIPFSSFGGFKINHRTCNNPTVLNQQITDCVYKVGNNISSYNPFRERIILDKKLEFGNNNKIEFEYKKLNANHLENDFEYICNISIAVADSMGVYDVEEIETVTYEFKFINSILGTPGEAFIEKIEEWENKDLVDNNFLDFLDRTAATLNDLCAVGVALDYVEAAGVATEIVGKAIEGVTLATTGVALKTVTRAGSQTYKVGKTAEDAMKAGAVGELGAVIRGETEGNWALGILGKACSLTSCSLSDEMADQGAEATWTENFMIDDYTENLNAMDPAESILSAASLGCWPAVAGHIKSYRDNQCSVLACFKESSLHGIDVNGCEAINDAYICSTLIGTAGELIGPVRFVKNAIDNAATYVKYLVPNVLIGASKQWGCDWADDGLETKSAWEITMCDIPDSLGRFILQGSLTENTRTYHYAPTENICQYALCSIEDIESGACEKPSTSWLAQFGALPRPTDEDLRSFNQNIQRDNLLGKYTAGELVRSLTRVWREKRGGEDVEPASDLDKDIVEQVFEGQDVDTVAEEDIRDLVADNGALNTRVEEMNTEEGRRSEEDLGEEDLQRTQEANANAETGVILQEMQDAAAAEVEESNKAAIEDDDPETNPTEPEDFSEAVADTVANLETAGEETAGLVGEDGKINENNMNALANDLTKREEEQRIRVHNQKAEKTANIISRILWGVVIEEYGTLSSIARSWADEDSWIVDFSEWLDTVSSDALTQSVCVASNNIGRGSVNQPGILRECDGADCSLVLTFGTERMQYNITAYLYSSVYVLGGVSEDVDYKVYFKKEDGTTVFAINTWRTLQAGKTDNIETADLSENKYTEMCFKFKRLFPPGALGTDPITNLGSAKKDFCRPISENIFATGNPASYSTEEGYSVDEEDIWGDI